MSTSSPRSALLASWGTAWLAGDVALPDLLDRVTTHDDDHVVVGLEPDDVPLDRALLRLRADGTTTLRLVLPAPGDVAALPGPGPFTSAALAASEGLLALRPDGTGHGLVPEVTAHGSELDGTVTTVRWSAHPLPDPVPDRGPWLHDAEHDLRVGVSAALTALVELDVARWDPDVADALDDLRRARRRGIGDGELPQGYSSRARELLVRCRQLATIVSLASQSTGGSIDTREAMAREAAFRELGVLVRRARQAAWNSYGTVT